MKKLSVLGLSFLMIFSFVSCQNESSEITTAASSAITADQTPVISGADDVTILQGATFDIMEGVTAYDPEDGDLTSAIQTDGFVDSTILGEHGVTYTVEDSAGNVARVVRIITVEFVVSNPYSLYNGDFSLSVGGWSLDQPGGEATFEVVDGVLEANLTNLGQEWWNIQMHQTISIEEGITYKLSFDAKTDTAKRIGIGMEDTDDGYVMLPGGDVVFELSNTMQTYEYYFTSDRSIDTAKFVLYLGRIGEDESPAKVYIDNCSVEIAEVDDSDIVFSGVDETNVIINTEFDVMSGVTAENGDGNDITANITTNNIVITNLSKGANYVVQYKVTDGETTKYVDRVIHIVLGKDDPTALYNPDFSLGILGWTLDFPVGQGTMTVEDGVLVANLTDLGTDWWHIQLHQSGLTITEGKTYLVTVIAKADGSKRIGLGIEDPANGYASLKSDEVNWDLTTEWQTFTYIFQARTSIDTAKYAIFMGKMLDSDTTTKVYIDLFKVEELEDSYPMFDGLTTINVVEGTTIDYMDGVTATDFEDGDITSNIVVNSSNVDIDTPGNYIVTYTITDNFGNVVTKERNVNILEDTAGPLSVVINPDMSTTDGWHFDFPGGEGTMEYVDGQVVAELTNLSDAWWKIQLQQDGISIVEGKLYLVSVDIMSSVDRVVGLGLEDPANGFADLKGESVEWNVNGDMTTYYYVFRAPTTIDTAKIALFLGQIAGSDPVSTVTVDNFNMVEIDDYNILLNSNFADDSHWNYDFPVGTGTMSAANNEVTIAITDPGTAWWHIQLHQTDVSIKDGYTYLVSFKIKSDLARRIALGIEDPANGYADLKGESVEWDIDGEWTTCYYIFNSNVTIDTAKFAIFLGQISGTDPASTVEVTDFVVIELPQ